MNVARQKDKSVWCLDVDNPTSPYNVETSISPFNPETKQAVHTFPIWSYTNDVESDIHSM